MPGGNPVGARIILAILALVTIAFPAHAESARGIDEGFFAPGGALDQSLPVAAVPAPGGLSGEASAAAPEGIAGAGTSATTGSTDQAASLGSGASEGVSTPDASGPGGASGEAGDPGLPLGADDLASSGLRMVAGLALVIALIFGVNAFLKRARGGSLGVAHGLIRRIATEPIGPNQAVTILEVAGKVLVVGITDKGMTPLGELDGEHADRVRLLGSQAAAANEGEGLRGGFGRALQGFTRGWRGEELTADAAVAPGMEATPARSSARRAPERRAAPLAGKPSGMAPSPSRFESMDPMPAGAAAIGAAHPRATDERRRRLDERASAFLAQQREALKGMNL